MDPPPDARAKDEANAKARETNVEEEDVVVGVLETVVVVVRRLSRTRFDRFVTTHKRKKRGRFRYKNPILSRYISSETLAHIIKSANKRRQSSLFRDDEKGGEEEDFFAMEDETRTL